MTNRDVEMKLMHSITILSYTYDFLNNSVTRRLSLKNISPSLLGCYPTARNGPVRKNRLEHLNQHSPQ